MDYADNSFRAFVTVNRTVRESVFFGMGTGALGARKQPDAGTGNACVFVELQEGWDNASRRVIGGTSGSPTNNEVGYDGMASVTGLMRLRMDYNAIAKTVSYAIDYNPSGPFVADQSFASVDVSAIAAEWTGGDNSCVFFGGQRDATFSDFVIDTSGLPFAGDPGRMTREVWYNIPGVSLSSFTASPRYFQPADSVTLVAGASVPQDIGEDFASRVRGYITAPLTGAYTFWIASDDQSVLRLSSSDSKFGTTEIASVPTWVQPFAWDTTASQKSAMIQLVAGQKYFFEALHKERGGGDHLAIAWQIPGGSRELIPASALGSYTTDANDLDNDDLPDDWEIAHGFIVAAANTTSPSQMYNADPDQDGYTNVEEAQLGTNPTQHGGLPGALLLETWQNLPGPLVADLTNSPRFIDPPDTTEFIFSAETPANRSDLFGFRLRGYVIAPASGNYIFSIAGDDSCELWISPTASKFEKRRVAWLEGYTYKEDWFKYPTQRSANIPLIAGQKYYLEARGKEHTGGDHLSIGWTRPSISGIQIISASHLESYARDLNDPDDDNLPTLWEIANGLDPAINDAAGDSDRDVISNFLEYETGSDPNVRNTYLGALTHAIWWNVPGNRTASLDTQPRLLQPADVLTLTSRASGAENQRENYAQRLRGYLTAPITGTYTFWAAGDDQVDFFLSTSESQFDKELLIRTSVIGRSMDTDLSQKSRSIQLVAGQRYYLEIRHIDSHQDDYCDVAWQVPGGIREIIPGSALSSFIPTADDMDDDGLPDAYELANGLSITDNGSSNPANGGHGDLDGDCLLNTAEWKSGTRADLADTDGDGLNDRDEVELTKTQALTADAAPFEPVISLDGSVFTRKHGSWFVNGKSLGQQNTRGWVEYDFFLTSDGVYQAKFLLTPLIIGSVSTPLDIALEIDGQQVGRDAVALQKGTETTVKMLTPWLASGPHKIRLNINNTVTSRRIAVNSLEIAAARGVDSNTNSTPDWVDSRILHFNSFEARAESYTSPVSLEGETRWASLSTVAGLPVQTGPNNRWFTNVYLDPEEATSVVASLENGAFKKTKVIVWKELNMLSVGNLTIRQGDSLRLTAFTGIEPTSAETVSINVAGQTYSIQANQPLTYKFSDTGVFPVQVIHTLDGITSGSTVAIEVLAAPIIESPVCVIGSYREVEIPPLPANVYLQLDDSIEIQSVTSDPDGTSRYILRLNTLDDRFAALRLGGNEGSMLGVIPFRAMQVSAGSDTSMLIEQSPFAGLTAVVMPVVIESLWPDTLVQIEIFIGGVTFDDGTLIRAISPVVDSDEFGTTQVRFLKTGVSGAVCHRISVWQNGKRIAWKE